MNRLRLRLDIGLDGGPRGDGAKPHSSCTAKKGYGGADPADNDGGERVRPEFDIGYDEQRTTFVHVLRDVVEARFLGGHLLEFLEFNSQLCEGGGREEFYVLMYSGEDTTVLQPFWSSPLSTVGTAHRDAANRFMLQISFGGSLANDEIIDPGSLVSTFLRKHFPKSDVSDGTKGSFENKRRKLGDQNDNCIDMKLTTTKIRNNLGKSWKPTKVSVFLCEEHWRQSGKLFEWNVLCTPRSPPNAARSGSLTASDGRLSRDAFGRMGDEQHHAVLKSFLIHNFFRKSPLSMAVAFLIPTALILRGLDTVDGIQLSVDKPSFCRVRSLNLERPAVLRQYFGITLDDNKAPLPDQLSPPERDDGVWRSCYGAGSGSRSVGIHLRHSTTREMTLAMKIIAAKVYKYLRRRFDSDASVTVHPFNHVTVLFYYQKVEPPENCSLLKQQMLGYHTDNVYSRDGLFAHDSNSQMENTFTALLTLGDGREVHFRRQEISRGMYRKWINSDTGTMPFFMKHGTLFLLHPHDEKPGRTNMHCPIHRYQHGHVKFPDPCKLSTVLAFRTVTSREHVHKYSGKLFMQNPAPPQMLPPPPTSTGEDAQHNVHNETEGLEVNHFLLSKFQRENLIDSDARLKELWLSVCSRHFQYQIQKQTV